MAMSEQVAQDLNHPYAYEYVCGPETLVPFADLQTDAPEPPTSRSSPYVSTLVSAIVHATILLVAGLIVAVLPKPNTIELELTKAPVASDQPVDMFVMDAEVDAPRSDDTESAFQLAEPELRIEELTLDADLAFAKTTQPQSVSTTESNSTNSEAEGRGSKFFGMAAYGNEFVYVLDISGSMGSRSKIGDYAEESFTEAASRMVAQIRGPASRFDIARNELLRSIENLKEEQSFCVILFNSDDLMMFNWNSGRLMAATDQNKNRLNNWMEGIRPHGGTNPANGLRDAFDMQPDAIFLLSDGKFNSPERVDRVVNQNLDRKIPLHTIAFESAGSRGRLRRYSQASNGRHRYVGSQSRAELLAFDLGSGNGDARDAMQLVLDEKVPMSIFEKATVGLSCARLLTSGDRSIARKAHDCLVKLTNGKRDLGPANLGKRKVVNRSSQRWREHFQSILREKSPDRT